jgi:hypothetical protein
VLWFWRATSVFDSGQLGSGRAEECPWPKGPRDVSVAPASVRRLAAATTRRRTTWNPADFTAGADEPMWPALERRRKFG